MAALLLAAQAKRGSSDICRSQRAAIILARRNTSDVQQETITKQSGGKHSEPVSGSAPPSHHYWMFAYVCFRELSAVYGGEGKHGCTGREGVAEMQVADKSRNHNK